MAGHALISPSSMAETELCPGRPAAIAGLPPELQEVSNIHADTGTAVHEVIAYCAQNPQYNPTQFVGHNVSVRDGAAEIAFTKDHALSAQMALTYYAERSKEYGVAPRIEAKVYPGRSYHYLPPQLWAPPEPLGPYLKEQGIEVDEISNGTADAIWDGAGTLEVADYKNGRYYVDERQNLQLTSYVLGAMADHDLEEQGPIQRVRATIIQPNSDGERVRTYQYESLDEVMELATRLGGIVQGALAPNAPRIPGDKQCHFCEFKHQCPEHAAWAGTVLDQALATAPEEHETMTPFDPFAQVAPPAAVDEAPVNLTPKPPRGDLAGVLVDALKGDTDALGMEARVAVLEAAPMLRAWLSSIEEGLLKEAQAGREVPGFKVVEGRGSRAWAVDEEETMRKLKNSSRIGEDGKAAGKLKRDEYTESKVISPAQAEKRIKPLVSARTWTNIEGMIERKAGKPALVPETDNRPALREPVEKAWADLPAAEQPQDMPDDDPPNVGNAVVRDETKLPPVPEAPGWADFKEKTGFDPFA